MKALFAVAGVGLAGLAGVTAVVSSSGGSSVGGSDTGFTFFSGGRGEYFGCMKAMPPDLQYQAEETQWAFRDAEATLEFAVAKPRPRYTVTATAAASTRGGLTAHVSLLGAEVFSFPAHAFTVFDIVGHRLYYADFDPAAAGVAVVSVDLTTGTELWRAALKGAGGGDGGTPHTRLNLTAGEDGVTVLGREAGGKYVEVLDPETGETAGHKVVE
jgi:hypothetical protein